MKMFNKTFYNNKPRGFMKNKESGMRSATMPKDHWQKNESQVMSCDQKYASEFGNPQDLQRSADALAAYVRKNKMKY